MIVRKNLENAKNKFLLYYPRIWKKDLCINSTNTPRNLENLFRPAV